MKDTIALVGICLLTFFAGLGSPAITDSDEGFYAESAREMVESGDWLTPHFNYSYRFEKPVLYYWLAAVTYTVAGVGAAAARFPAALSGVGLVLITFAYARRLYGRQIGLLAGVITATSFGYVAMARQALPDLTLALFLTIATWAALVAWLDPPPGDDRPPLTDRARLGWAVLAAIGVAGALLTKGPVGLALPGIVVGPLLAWEYWSGRSQPRIRLSHVGVCLAVFLLLGAPWYLAMTLEHGTAYLDRFFIGENLDRFATARYNDPRAVWYYLPIVFSGMLPWSPFMLLWIPAVKRLTRQGIAEAVVGSRLLWWAAAPLVFYTLSVGKQPRYILPVLPPLAILLALAIHNHLSRGLDGRLFSVCTGVAGVVLVGIAGLVYRAAPLFVDWESSWIIAAAGAIAVSGLSVLFSVGRPKSVLWVLPTAAVVITLSAHFVVLSSPGPAPVERMAEMLVKAAGDGQRSGRYNIFNRNLIFYAGLPLEELSAPEAARDFLVSATPVFLVLPDDEIPRVESLGVSLRRLGDVRYLNTGTFQMRTLVTPDPTRYLRRVVLVTNKRPGVE